MADPSKWTEDDVLALPAGENDSFERKGSMSLDLKLPKVKEDEVLNELAKQLSAFANASGGQIIYGVANNGTVDAGGVALSVKGRHSTKEWLEDVIPKLTEFEIVGFNVYEIGPSAGSSKISGGKAIFVVDVPASDRAPHQSKRDLKYYIRLAGKSHPAPHRMIEDIRNRQKHPLLELASMQIRAINLPIKIPSPEQQFLGLPPSIDGEGDLFCNLSIENVGSVMARNTCLRLGGSGSIRWRDYDNSTIRARSQSESAFWEFIDPIYPGMKISFWINGTVPVHYQSAECSLEGRPLRDLPLSRGNGSFKTASFAIARLDGGYFLTTHR